MSKFIFFISIVLNSLVSQGNTFHEFAMIQNENVLEARFKIVTIANGYNRTNYYDLFFVEFSKGETQSNPTVYDYARSELQYENGSNYINFSSLDTNVTYTMTIKAIDYDVNPNDTLQSDTIQFKYIKNHVSNFAAQINEDNIDFSWMNNSVNKKILEVKVNESNFSKLKDINSTENETSSNSYNPDNYYTYRLRIKRPHLTYYSKEITPEKYFKTNDNVAKTFDIQFEKIISMDVDENQVALIIAKNQKPRLLVYRYNENTAIWYKTHDQGFPPPIDYVDEFHQVKIEKNLIVFSNYRFRNGSTDFGFLVILENYNSVWQPRYCEYEYNKRYLGESINISNGRIIASSYYRNSNGYRQLLIFEKVNNSRWDIVRSVSINGSTNKSITKIDAMDIYHDEIAVLRHETNQVLLFERNYGGSNAWGIKATFSAQLNAKQEGSLQFTKDALLIRDTDELSFRILKRSNDANFESYAFFDENAAQYNGNINAAISGKQFILSKDQFESEGQLQSGFDLYDISGEEINQTNQIRYTNSQTEIITGKYVGIENTTIFIAGDLRMQLYTELESSIVPEVQVSTLFSPLPEFRQYADLNIRLSRYIPQAPTIVLNNDDNIDYFEYGSYDNHHNVFQYKLKLKSFGTLSFIVRGMDYLGNEFEEEISLNYSFISNESNQIIELQDGSQIQVDANALSNSSHLITQFQKNVHHDRIRLNYVYDNNTEVSAPSIFRAQRYIKENYVIYELVEISHLYDDNNVQSYENLEHSIDLSRIVDSELIYKKTEMVQPESYELKQNYPNPFNPSTTISFSIMESENVKLSIYNILGQHIRTLVNRQLPSGTHDILWNGQNERGLDVPSGVYFYALELNNRRFSKKMILSK